MLNVKVLRPSKHYFPWGYNDFSDEGCEGNTFINTTYKNEERIV
jgi:hypothetical protein